ncbi:amidohydrolase family protein [Enterocloster citroniae]
MPSWHPGSDGPRQSGGDDPDAVMGGLSWSEAFYLATKGGGSFWGKAGSFEPGYLFDAVVLDDTSIADLSRRSTCERIERLIQAGDDRNIVAKYIEGRLVYGSGK